MEVPGSAAGGAGHRSFGPRYENGFVTMSATTTSSTAMSKRATSMIRRMAASVSGAVGPFDSASSVIRLACGYKIAIPVNMVIA